MTKSERAAGRRRLSMPVLCGAAAVSVIGAAAVVVSAVFSGLAALTGTMVVVERGATTPGERAVGWRWAACLPAAVAAVALRQLLEELRTALRRGQLVLHHQPQLDVATGRLLGVEALVRWEHPTRGLLPPSAFLDLAESQGLMGQLTDLVLAQAVTQLASWRSAGLTLRMSVNLSASNLLDVGLPARVQALLAHHDVPAAALTLEVTETVLVQDSDSASATLVALSATGVDLSIDDFGTGWSTLAYLRRLPAQELKLDASFTRDLLTDHRTRSIVASTITLAHELGLRIVAEGAEDRPTLLHLHTMGCDVSQGYLHARPMPASRVLAWVRSRDELLTGTPAPHDLVAS